MKKTILFLIGLLTTLCSFGQISYNAKSIYMAGTSTLQLKDTATFCASNPCPIGTMILGKNGIDTVLFIKHNKKWVAVGGGGVTGADNGLSLSGTTVELGGPLIKNTSINLGSAFGISLPNTAGTVGLKFDNGGISNTAPQISGIGTAANVPVVINAKNDGNIYLTNSSPASGTLNIGIGDPSNVTVTNATIQPYGINTNLNLSVLSSGAGSKLLLGSNGAGVGGTTSFLELDGTGGGFTLQGYDGSSNIWVGHGGVGPNTGTQMNFSNTTGTVTIKDFKTTPDGSFSLVPSTGTLSATKLTTSAPNSFTISSGAGITGVPNGQNLVLQSGNGLGGGIIGNVNISTGTVGSNTTGNINLTSNWTTSLTTGGTGGGVGSVTNTISNQGMTLVRNATNSPNGYNFIGANGISGSTTGMSIGLTGGNGFGTGNTAGGDASLIAGAGHGAGLSGNVQLGSNGVNGSQIVVGNNSNINLSTTGGGNISNSVGGNFDVTSSGTSIASTDISMIESGDGLGGGTFLIAANNASAGVFIGSTDSSTPVVIADNTTTPTVSLTVNSTGISYLVNGLTASLKNILSAQAGLDFPNTTTGVSDLTVTVTGAQTGNGCYVGVPNGSITSTASFWCWVSSTDTVTVRFSPKAVGGENPAPGTFTVYVTSN